MIDLHCHILPGLDDGAQTEEQALAMARIAAADGITDIVATPHTYNGLYKNPTERVINSINQFQSRLNQENIFLQVHPGNEVHIHVEFFENVTTDKVLTVSNGKKYVLLELPVQSIPYFTDDLLFELSLNGITPIIAHPERNLVLREEPNRLADWIERGAIAQITAGSILGILGERSLKAAEMMVANRLAHIIASDAHNCERRRPELSAAYQRISKLTTVENVLTFQSAAKAILLGEKLQVAEPIKLKKKKWFLFN